LSHLLVMSHVLRTYIRSTSKMECRETQAKGRFCAYLGF